jgi:hypothetical protein
MPGNRDTIIQLLERLKEEKHPGAQTLKVFLTTQIALYAAELTRVTGLHQRDLQPQGRHDGGC